MSYLHIIDSNPKVIDSTGIESGTEKVKNLWCLGSRQETTWGLKMKVYIANRKESIRSSFSRKKDCTQ